MAQTTHWSSSLFDDHAEHLKAHREFAELIALKNIVQDSDGLLGVGSRFWIPFEKPEARAWREGVAAAQRIRDARAEWPWPKWEGTP